MEIFFFFLLSVDETDHAKSYRVRAALCSLISRGMSALRSSSHRTWYDEAGHSCQKYVVHYAARGATYHGRHGRAVKTLDALSGEGLRPGVASLTWVPAQRSSSCVPGLLSAVGLPISVLIQRPATPATPPPPNPSLPGRSHDPRHRLRPAAPSPRVPLAGGGG